MHVSRNVKSVHPSIPYQNMHGTLLKQTYKAKFVFKKHTERRIHVQLKIDKCSPGS